MTEFKLKDKLIKKLDWTEKFVFEEDIKEFIRLLKDLDFQLFVVKNCKWENGDYKEYCYFNEDEMFKEIDKLTGFENEK